jgi:hypothetical protein
MNRHHAALDRARLRAVRGDDGSMLLAVILTVVALALLAVITGNVLSQERKTQGSLTYNAAERAENNAMQTALFALNNSHTPPASSSPVTGTDAGGGTWSYYGTKTTILGNPVWTVTAAGTSGGTTETETGLISLLPSFSYIPYPSALFTDTSTTLLDGTVGSYTPGGSYDSDGYAGTNGTLNFGSAVSNIDGYDLYDWYNKPDSGRCLQAGTGQCTWTFGEGAYRETIGNSQAVTNAAACAGTLTAYTGGTIPAGTTCYSSMAFTGNTTTTATASSPATIYVTGNVTFSANATVNATAGAGISNDGSAIDIIAAGTKVTIGSGVTADVLLDAPQAACTSAGKVNIYGALTCSSFTASSTTAATNVYLDDSIPTGETAPVGVPAWAITTITNVK